MGYSTISCHRTKQEAEKKAYRLSNEGHSEKNIYVFYEPELYPDAPYTVNVD